MSDKRKVVEKLMPVAVLKAITPEAARAVSQLILVDNCIIIRSFPFRVGRESRVKIMGGRVERIERVNTNQMEPNNDLYLLDDGGELNIAREHFQIEKDGGKYYLNDRGSTYGTMVGEEYLCGNDPGATVALSDGDTIAIGNRQSPYVYKFILLDGLEICEGGITD